MTPYVSTQRTETSQIPRPKWLPEEVYPFEIRALGTGDSESPLPISAKGRPCCSSTQVCGHSCGATS